MHSRRFRLRPALAGVIAIAVGTIGLSGCAATADPDGGGDASKSITIGISQPFMTNAWQQTLVDSAEWAAEELKADGYDITLKVVDANGNPQTQIQQINDLVLSGVDVLLVNPSSASALDGAIEDAIAAGIPTVSFADGPVTSTEPYELEFDVAAGQEAIARATFDSIGGSGNVLNVRGAAGSGADPLWQSGVEKALADYPNINVVAEVYGDWDESTAQSRVAGIMSTLPEVDAVVTQGQMGYGVAQAFLAAGREVPMQVFGLPGIELNLWRQLYEESGFTTTASSADAGIGSIAVNVAVALYNGEDVPKKMVAPFLTITQDTLPDFADLGDNDNAYKNYDYTWTEENILTQ